MKCVNHNNKLLNCELNLWFSRTETDCSAWTRPCPHTNQIQSWGWFDFLIEQRSKAECLVFREWRALGHIQWPPWCRLVYRCRLDINQSNYRIRWYVSKVCMGTNWSLCWMHSCKIADDFINFICFVHFPPSILDCGTVKRVVNWLRSNAIHRCVRQISAIREIKPHTVPTARTNKCRI